MNRVRSNAVGGGVPPRRLGSPSQRPLRDVPFAVVVALVLALTAQIGWKAVQPEPAALYHLLPEPPDLTVLRIQGLGEDATYARLLVLWLQAHDTQPGLSLPLRELDYERVLGWLGAAQRLDPRTQLPLLAVARVYAAVADEDRRRASLAFLEAHFLEAPNRRWRWLAEAAIIAKHRLKDLPLALRYAQALRRHATSNAVPFWAKDMEIILLEDMGELEAATVLIGGLLAGGHIDDPVEIRYLEHKLRELEATRAAPVPDTR